MADREIPPPFQVAAPEAEKLERRNLLGGQPVECVELQAYWRRTRDELPDLAVAGAS